ncbi:MAG: thiamine phosphate synthase [Armatimonadota bacterium]|nr:thiamine phosphate synthase [Armatimonadota bacterium]
MNKFEQALGRYLRPNLANFLATDIYGITADDYSRGRGNVETVRLMIAAGIKVIQYRDNDKSARQMYEECLAIRELTRSNGVTFIVNDHVDLAVAVEADGVHIGQDDLPPEKARQLAGDEMIIGLSTHSPSQAQAAMGLADVIDYIGVGPIFATNTKKDVCEPVGLEYLDYVVKNISLPFVAIGGIKEHNIGLVRAGGAGIISLVTEIVGAPDISAKVAAIRTALAGCA